MKRLMLLSSIIITAMLTACGGSSGAPSALSSVVSVPTTPTNPNNPTNSSASGAFGLIYNEQTKRNFERDFSNGFGSPVTVDSLVVNVDGSNYNEGVGLSFDNFAQTTGGEFEPHAISERRVISTSQGEKLNVDTRGTLYLFKQQYSAIAQVNFQNSTLNYNGQSTTVDSTARYVLNEGNLTATLPATGIYTYNGPYRQSATENASAVTGTFTYDMDFDAKEGHGKITRGTGAAITLDTAPIGQYSWTTETGDTHMTLGVERGNANTDLQMGTYRVALYGPDAEEMLGRVEFNEFKGDFAGSRQ